MLSFAEIKKGLFPYEEVSGGFIATFRSAEALIAAAKKAKEANVQRFDCFSPCPLHGLDKAMGLNRSWLPFLTLVGGLMAVTLGLLYITFIDVINWPIVYGGKPFFSWPAYVPVLFELGIYFASAFTAAGVIVLGRLGFINRKPPAAGVTSDTFAIWLGDENLTRADVERILAGLNPQISEVKA
ncbi:MAG: DUF3341 domain-containing protein [Turneriella sp.]|nr:DUF3341 domain-containing protein [Turneriella sp.]